MEYSFGTGDGITTTWTSEADLDLGGHGHADAVRLDFDGDGAADDAMWDSDGDGVADTTVLDFGDDAADRFFADPSHLGVWDREVGLDGADQMRWSEPDIQESAMIAADYRSATAQVEPVEIRQPDLSAECSDGAGVRRWNT